MTLGIDARRYERVVVKEKRTVDGKDSASAYKVHPRRLFSSLEASGVEGVWRAAAGLAGLGAEESPVTWEVISVYGGVGSRLLW